MESHLLEAYSVSSSLAHLAPEIRRTLFTILDPWDYH